MQMDVKKFRVAMYVRGSNPDELAEAIGCKRWAFNRKIREQTFRAREISTLARVMSLTKDEFVDIFYH